MTTPRMSIPYPEKFRKDWFEIWKSMISQIDAHHFASFEDRGVFAALGGEWTFVVESGLLSWSSALRIVTPSTGQPQDLAAGSVVVADGEFVWVLVSRGAVVPGALWITAGSMVPVSDAALPIAVRVGEKIYFRNGIVLADEPFEVFEASAPFGAGPSGPDTYTAANEYMIDPSFEDDDEDRREYSSIEAALTAAESEGHERVILRLADGTTVEWDGSGSAAFSEVSMHSMTGSTLEFTNPSEVSCRLNLRGLAIASPAQVTLSAISVLVESCTGEIRFRFAEEGEVSATVKRSEGVLMLTTTDDWSDGFVVVTIENSILSNVPLLSMISNASGCALNIVAKSSLFYVDLDDDGVFFYDDNEELYGNLDDVKFIVLNEEVPL